MTRELLKARFTKPRRDLLAVLDHLQDSDLEWSPGDGMRTISNQFFEIAGKEVEVLAWVRTGVWDDDKAYAESFSTVGQWRQELESIRRHTFAFIDEMTEAELSRPFKNPNSWQEGLGLPECPVAEVIGFIATHEWYHVGQLTTYAWLRGDNPDSW